MKKLFLFFVLALTLVASASAVLTHESQIKIWSDFNGGTTVLTDEKGFQDGVIAGTLIRNNTDKPSGLDYSLTGVFNHTNYAYWASNPASQDIAAADNRTFIVWFKTPAADKGLSGDYGAPTSTGYFGTSGTVSFFYLLKTANPVVNGQSLTQLSGWHMYGGVYDGTTQNISLYHDGVFMNTTSASAISFPMQNSAPRKLGYADEAALTSAVQGVAQWIIINETLNQTQWTCLYNSGTGRNYTSFVNNCINATSDNYLTITTTNSYTGASINNFTALVNGTYYSNTTGNIIYTTINQNASSSLINITVNATNYLNKIYSNYNTSSDLSATLHQAEITFHAYNRVNGSSVTTFTASTTNNTATATNPTLNLSVGTYTATFSKNLYYPSTLTFTTTALEQTNKNFTIYDHVLNTTINVLGGSNTNQNFNIDIYSLNYSYHERISTTNGEAIANLTAGTYTVYLNDSLHTLEAVNITLNASSNYTSLSIDVYNINTIIIEFRDEETNALITNNTVTVFLTGDVQSYNYTTTNGTLLAELLAPQSYVITYSANNYSQREYVITLSNQTYEILTLYLLPTASEDLVLITVQDLVGSSVSNATVYTQRKNLSGTNYYTVETCTTGSAGTCIQHLILYDVTYRFIVEYEGVIVKTTTDQKINSVSVILSVDLNTDELQDIEQILGTTGLLTWTNSTSTFTYTWLQNSGLPLVGCVRVIQQSGASFTEINSSCGTSTAAGTTTVTINTVTGDSFNAVGYVIFNGYESITNTLTVNLRTLALSFGATGLFLIGFFILGTLAIIGLNGGVSGPLILMVAGLGIFSFIGFINVGVGVVGGLFIIVVGFMVMKK